MTGVLMLLFVCVCVTCELTATLRESNSYSLKIYDKLLQRIGK